MFSHFWNILFYKPLYNALVFFVSVFPLHSMFIAVIILTIIVRIILYPLSFKALKTQIGMSRIKGKLKEIQKNYPDKQEQAKKTMELYKEHGVNPFSSFFTILIQLPIIIALYRVFQNFSVKGLDSSLLYNFVSKPDVVNLTSFGINLAEKSILLALLTGITQYIYLNLSSSLRKKIEEKDGVVEKTAQEKMMESVGSSMKYTMPIIITIVAYIAGGALALYWFVSNIFIIIQEKYIHRKLGTREVKRENG